MLLCIIDLINLRKVAQLVKETQFLNIVLQNIIITKDSTTSKSVMPFEKGSVGFYEIYFIPEVTNDYKSTSSKL